MILALFDYYHNPIINITFVTNKLITFLFTVKVNNEWECISGEDYQWNLLIERLEQLCHLNGTLNYCSEQPVGTLYCIKYEYLPITLTDLLKHGQGNLRLYIL